MKKYQLEKAPSEYNPNKSCIPNISVYTPVSGTITEFPKVECSICNTCSAFNFEGCLLFGLSEVK